VGGHILVNLLGVDSLQAPENNPDLCCISEILLRSTHFLFKPIHSSSTNQIEYEGVTGQLNIGVENLVQSSYDETNGFLTVTHNVHKKYIYIKQID
jgi:hypothetical protein